MARSNAVALLILICLFQAAFSQNDTLQVASRSRVVEAQKARRSPMGALMRSVAAPGWGQFYNHKYVKSAIVFGVESFFIVKSVHWLNKTEDQYKISQETDSAKDFNTYLQYRGVRNDYLWGLGITIFISMFDAYIDAHLSGFDIDITPDFEDEKTPALLHIRYRF